MRGRLRERIWVEGGNGATHRCRESGHRGDAELVTEPAGEFFHGCRGHPKHSLIFAGPFSNVPAPNIPGSRHHPILATRTQPALAFTTRG